MARLIGWNEKFERVCEPSGAFEMPEISIQGRVFAYQALLRVRVFRMFFEFGKLVGCGAKVASSPQDKHQ